MVLTVGNYNYSEMHGIDAYQEVLYITGGGPDECKIVDLSFHEKKDNAKTLKSSRHFLCTSSTAPNFHLSVFIYVLSRTKLQYQIS